MTNLGEVLANTIGVTEKELRKNMDNVEFTIKERGIAMKKNKITVNREDVNRAFLFDLKIDIIEAYDFFNKEYDTNMIITMIAIKLYMKAHARDKHSKTPKRIKQHVVKFNPAKKINAKKPFVWRSVVRLINNVILKAKLGKLATFHIINKSINNANIANNNFMLSLKALNIKEENINMNLQLFGPTIVQSQKNRITPKESINTRTIIVGGWKDADPDSTTDSAILYSQSSASVLSREIAKSFPLISERRWVGTSSLQKSFNNLTRHLNNIQDAMLTAFIWFDDKVSRNMNRLYISEDGRVFVEMKSSDELNNQFLSEDFPADGEFAEIINNKVYTKEQLKDVDIKVYEDMLFSPSQERKEGTTYFKTAEGKFSDISESLIKKGRNKIYDIVDTASDGMLNILKKKGYVPFKKAVKGYARLSQIMTPSTELCKAISFALILDDDYMTPADGGGIANTNLRARGLKSFYSDNVHFPVNQLAGQVVQARPLGCKNAFIWSRPEVVKDMLNTFAVIKMKREDITEKEQKELELCFEGKSTKYKSRDIIFENNKLYQKVDDNFKEFIPRDKQLKKDLIDSFNNNGRFIVKDGVIHLVYVLILGDEQDTPDFITDLNGFKAPVDFRNPARFVILDESKEMQDSGKLSMQMLSTLLLNKNSINELEKYMLENIDEDYKRFKESTSSNPTIESMQKFYLGNFMQTAAKHFIYEHDASAYRTLCNNFLNSQNKKLDRFNLYVKDSTFARLIPDWSLFLTGKKLLKEGECYSQDANKAYLNIERDLIKDIVDYQKENKTPLVSSKSLRESYSIDEIGIKTDDSVLLDKINYLFDVKQNHTVIVFRSPKMVFGEFGRFNAVTNNVLTDRINKLNISDNRKTNLINFFKDLKEGTFVLPAYNKYQELLGGADFDFDGVNVICDQRFIKMMKDIKPTIVSVEKSKPDSSTKFKIGDFDTAYEIFIRQAYNGNMSIGQITNMNQLLQMLLYVPDNFVKWLFKRHFKNENKSKETTYVSPLNHNNEVIVITPDLTKEIKERICTAKLSSRQEINTIIFDLNIVLRSYQERTIDAAKTGEVIDVLFNLSTDSFALCLSDEVSCNIKWSTSSKDSDIIKLYNKNNTRISKLKDKFGHTKETLTINDVFHDIKRKCCDRLAEYANEMINHEKAIKFTPEQIQYIKNIGKKYTKLVNDLLNISYRYNEANSIRIGMINKIAESDGYTNKLYRKTIIPEISKKHNETVYALRNMVRTIFAKYHNKAEVAALLKYVSFGKLDENGNFQIDENKRSSICHTLLPEEYALLVSKLDEDTKDIAISRVYFGKKFNNEEVKIINGIAQLSSDDNREPFITHKDINGVFNIKKENKSSFISKDIKDFINIETPSKKQLVLKLVLKKGSNYADLYNKVLAHKNKIMLVNCYGFNGSKQDSVSFITDEGVLMPCSKYQASKGKSLFGSLYSGFQGVLSSINFQQIKDKTGKIYGNLLIVLDEVDTKIKCRQMNKQEIKDNIAKIKEANRKKVNDIKEQIRKRNEEIRLKKEQIRRKNKKDSAETNTPVSENTVSESAEKALNEMNKDNPLINDNEFESIMNQLGLQ